MFATPQTAPRKRRSFPPKVPEDRYLRTRAVLAYVGVSRTTLFVWCRDRGFPKPFDLGTRCKLYRKSEVDGWLAKNGRAT